jgi:CTP:molybdopterin cytidylyltransferase MocA
MKKFNDTGIWVIIPAAGESRRMGMPKMTLPFGSSTVIGKVISNIREAGLANIIAVAGAEKTELPLLLQKLSVNYCFNFHYQEGMLSSVICGISQIPENTAGIMIIPGDQPLISPRTITRIASLHTTYPDKILIASFNGKRGHPLLFPSRFREEVGNLDRDAGLKALSLSHPQDVLEIETYDSGVLKDIDTYDEYISEINQIS